MRRSLLILTLSALLLAFPGAHAEEASSTATEQRPNSLLYALSLIGTPYKMGGSTPDKGLDCSGFVRHVYKNTAGVSLPHNAKQMSQNGETVKKDELKPGDLVFFNTLKRPFSHVGIYKGNGQFIHASSRKQKAVTVSNMNDSYWAKRFNGARRMTGLD